MNSKLLLALRHTAGIQPAPSVVSKVADTMVARLSKALLVLLLAER